MSKKIRTYKDSKELPFLIYKKIMQTGDFLYMIKGYEEGDTPNVDPKEMEEKFNALIQDFIVCGNSSSEEIFNHSNYIMASLEYNKITAIIEIIDGYIRANQLLSEYDIDESEEDNKYIADLLEDVIIERHPDPEIQRKILIEKRAMHENNMSKYKDLLEKDNAEIKEDIDIDKLYIDVYIGLEISPQDERIVSLYQFSILTDRVLEKIKAMDKINSK